MGKSGAANCITFVLVPVIEYCKCRHSLMEFVTFMRCQSSYSKEYDSFIYSSFYWSFLVTLLCTLAFFPPLGGDPYLQTIHSQNVI